MKKNSMLSLLALSGSIGAGTALAQSDLSVSKTAPASVVAGNNLTYSVQVTNNGPDDANNMVLSDPLPAGTTFVSATQTDGPTATLSTPAVGANGTVSATLSSFGAKTSLLGAGYMTQIGNVFYFSASDKEHGQELWKSDGTPEGTSLVADIREGVGGSNPAYLTNLNGTLYFQAYDPVNAWSLWKSDGTAAGTVLVKGAIQPSNLTVMGNTLFFEGYNLGYGLWKTDGTTEGTVQIKSGVALDFIVVVGTTLFFRGYTSAIGYELWKSDGTNTGTVLVKDLYPGGSSSFPQNLLAVNNTLFFWAYNGTYNGLWKTDGTAAGTVAAQSNFYATSVAEWGGQFYFGGSYSGINGLWKTDGTFANPTLIKALPNNNFSNPMNLVGSNGTLFFTAEDTTNGHELWKSDGTTAGTVLVKDINPGANDSNPYSLTAFNNTLYFAANGGINGQELWKSDGTTTGTVPSRRDVPATLSFDIVAKVATATRGTLINTATATCEADNNGDNNSGTALTSITPPPSTNLTLTKTAPANGTRGQNLTYTLTAEALSDNPAYDVELQDILPAGTTFVSAAQKSGPAFAVTTPAVGESGTFSAKLAALTPKVSMNNTQSVANANGTLFFYANVPTRGAGLWKSDGSQAGTVLVKAGVSANYLATAGNIVYFSSGFELWKSDGTAAGTVLLKSNFVNFNLTAVGNTLFCQGFDLNNTSVGYELWKSDGTVAGTVLVKDIIPGSTSSNPKALTNVNGTLFFQAGNNSDPYDLWKSDGTAAGTVLVKTSVDSTTMGVLGSEVYFRSYDATNGQSLWKSNGSSTVLVKTNIFPDAFGKAGNTLYFTGTNYSSTEGGELWKTDGTTAGTVLVKDIRPGTGSGYPYNYIPVGNTIYFRADNGTKGYELWKSDGTEAGTVLVKDIYPGSNASNAQPMASLGNTLFLGANDGTNGQELWTSDGTEAGTVPFRLSQISSFEVVVNLGSSVGAKVSNTATITSSNADTDDSNNSSTADTIIPTAPSALTLSRNSVQEKMPSGTFVGGFSTTDANAGESFTYSLVTGDGDSDNNQFTIDRANLRTNAVFDAAVKSSYSIRVRTTDRDGLFFEQAFTITVLETGKPVVTISSPTTNQKVLISALTGDVLSGAATDNVGVVAVKARLSRKVGTANEYWNGTSFGATQAWLSATLNAVTVDTVGGPNVTWTLDGQLPAADKLQVGAYALQVYALDAANNKSAYANGTFNIVSDMVAPTLSISTPTTSQKLLMSDFNGSAVSGSVNDDLGVASVKVRLSRKRGTTNEYWNGTDFVTSSAYVDATIAGTSWSLGAATPAAEKLDNGAYLVEAYALDNGGNKSATSKVSFSLNTDYSAPTVGISTPTSSKVIKIGEFGAGVITGTASDNIGVTSVKLKLQRKRGTSYEYWNGTAFTPTSVLFDATYNSETGAWSYDTAIPASALDAGGYTVYATAFDAAGNKTTSASRTFSIVGTPSASDALSAPADKSAGSS